MRKLIFGALVAILAFAMIGCPTDGGGDGGGTTPTTYTVTFNSNSGSAVAQQTIESGGKVTEPTAPTRQGYVFDGWYKESGLTNKWNFGTDTVTGNITLHAKWLQEFTVTFIVGEGYTGIPVPAATVVAGGNLGTLPTVEWTEKGTLEGWYLITEIENPNPVAFVATTAINSNITLVAKWSTGGFIVETVTISFDWGAYLTASDAPANPEANPANEVIPKGYALSLVLTDMPTPPTWFGHRFDRWIQQGASGSPPPAITVDTEFDDDATLVATWTAFPVITFNFEAKKADGTDFPATDYTGNLPADGAIKIEAGNAIGTDDFPADLVSTDDGFIFDGYYNGTEKVDATTVFDSTTSQTITITAKFIEDTRITITFAVDDSHGGTYTPPAPVKIEPGTALGDKFPGPVEYTGTSDYMFDEWYDEDDEVVDGDTTFDVDTTLTAKFKEGIFITFYLYKGEDGDPDGAEVAKLVIQPNSNLENAGHELPTAPSRISEGLVFHQWVRADGSEVKVDTIFSAASSVYGTWFDNELTIDATDVAANIEMVYLENGAYVIYEFDVDGIDIADIEGLEVQYRASGATIGSKQIRNVRLLGPYIYSDFITHIDNNGNDGRNNIPYFGDFVIDRNGAFTAKYIANAGASDYSSDKNGPYINYNGSQYVNGGEWAGGFGNPAGGVTANTWWTYTYTFSQANFSGALGSGNGWTVAKVNKLANAKVATDDTKKIYFGIGITSPAQDKGKAGGDGIVQLIKGVKLNINGDDPINGTVPEFALPGGGTSKQVFSSYIDPVVMSWRGPITVATDPKDDGTFTVISTPAYPPQSGGSVNVGIGDVDFGAYDETTGQGYFFANLGDWQTASMDDGSNLVGQLVTGTFTGNPKSGPLSVSFSTTARDRQRLNIGLFPDHITQLKKLPTNIIITITGTSDSTVNFRYSLASPFEGGSWQGTNLISGPLNSLLNTPSAPSNVYLDALGNSEADPVVPPKPQNLEYFILQRMAAGAVDVTITEIKIEYSLAPPPPPEPCDCEDEGDCDGLFMVGCHVPEGGLCTCPKPGTLLQNLNAISGIQPSGPAGTVKYRQLDNGTLFVYDRQSDYATIDLQIFTEASESEPWRVVVDPAKYYRLTVTGKVVRAPDAWALQAQLVQGGAPYGQHAVSNVTTGTEGDIVSYSVEVTNKTGQQLASPNTRIRLHDTGGTAGTYNPSFLVESIVLIELDEEDGDDVGEPLISFPPVDDDDE